MDHKGPSHHTPSCLTNNASSIHSLLWVLFEQNLGHSLINGRHVQADPEVPKVLRTKIIPTLLELPTTIQMVSRGQRWVGEKARAREESNRGVEPGTCRARVLDSPDRSGWATTTRPFRL